MFAIVVAAAHALVLALPAYLILRRWFELGFVNSVAAGSLIGGIPVTILVFVDRLSGGYAPPLTTLAQVWEMLGPSAVCAGLGVLGGVAFRAVVGRTVNGPNYAATFQ